MANFLSLNHINYVGLWVAAQSAIFLKHFSSFKKRCWWIFSLLTCNLKKRKVGVRAGVSKRLRTHTPRRGSNHSGCSLPLLRRKWQQGELSWAMPSPFVMWFFLRTTPPSHESSLNRWGQWASKSVRNQSYMQSQTSWPSMIHEELEWTLRRVRPRVTVCGEQAHRETSGQAVKHKAGFNVA